MALRGGGTSPGAGGSPSGTVGRNASGGVAAYSSATRVPWYHSAPPTAAATTATTMTAGPGGSVQPPATPREVAAPATSRTAPIGQRNAVTVLADAQMRRRGKSERVKSWQILFVNVWTVFAIVLLVSLPIIVPTIAAFPDLSWHDSVVSVAYCLFFATDMIVQDWMLSIRRRHQQKVTPSAAPINASTRFRRFFNRFKSWRHCADIITAVPFAALISFLPEENVPNRHVVASLNLLFLFHLRGLPERFQGSRVRAFVERTVLFRISSAGAVMIRMFVVIFLFFHVTACIMNVLVWLRNESIPPFVDINLEGSGEKRWERYSWGLLGAISNCFMVTSPMHPSSPHEIWVYICLISLGACLSATFHGAVAAYFAGEQGNLNGHFSRKIDQMAEYLNNKRTPPDLTSKVIQSFHSKYQGRSFDEKSILAGLNPCLRQELLLHDCKPLVMSISLLSLPENDPRQSWILRELSSGLQTACFSPTEFIYCEGLPGSDMYLIVEGIAAVSVANISLGYLAPGTIFGELAMFAPGPRLETVKAVTQVNCFVFRHSLIQSVADVIPEVAARLLKLQDERVEAVRQYYESSSCE
ncbi:cyclic nucleotide-binding-like protein [Zopfochytrium polystomum]|nr:cyclic nucleotide-binding-like protein [Zopfochytrium polystomum]